jgi:VWFA-related protein
MFPMSSVVEPVRARVLAVFVALTLLAGLASVVMALPAPAQTQPPPPTGQKQEPPPEAGGPQTEVGPIAVPKKKEEPPPEKPRPRKQEPLEDFSLRVDVPLVNVDVLVTTKDGQFIPGLKAENFRIFEDGVQQKVSSFSQSAEKPITAVLTLEFAATNYYFLNDALNAGYAFASSLKKEDWVAVSYYDMKPHILVDFTQEKRAVYGALNTLRMPTWRETNLFDALYDMMDRLDRVEGRKYVILISSGRDTFSKLNYDDVLKKLKETQDVTIFAISTGQWVRIMADPYMSGTARLDYLQADNQMNTFARMTGGRAYFPRFEGALRDVFGDIAESIRNQYTLAYRPTNSKQDGTYRKIKVEVTDEAGQPLRVKNQKGKDVKYQVLAREGYNARREVE